MTLTKREEFVVLYTALLLIPERMSNWMNFILVFFIGYSIAKKILGDGVEEKVGQ